MQHRLSFLGLSGLPLHTDRTRRDTLFVLFIVAITLLPMTTFTPPLLVGLFIVMWLWRLFIVLWQRPLPRKLILFTVLGASVAGIGLAHGSLFTRDSAVSLLMLLLIFKTFELNHRRDTFLLFFLAFFCLIMNFLYLQNLLVTVHLVLTVWLLMTALVNLNRPVGIPPLSGSATIAAKLMLIGLPFSILLFLLFPRIDPLWAIPQPTPQAQTGLNDELTLGQVSQLAQDESIVARFRFTPFISPSRLYFRGPILDQQIGTTWKSRTPHEIASSAIRSMSPPIVQAPQPQLNNSTPSTRTNNPTAARSFRFDGLLHRQPGGWVIVPEITANLQLTQSTLDDQSLIRTSQAQWKMPDWKRETIEVKGFFIDSDHHSKVLPQTEHWHNTQIDPTQNPRLQAFVATLKQDPTKAHYQAMDWVNWIFGYLRQQPFRYTLSPGRLPSTHTLDAFWFDSQQGFCEHYAASFTFIFRLLGIPTRIVTGYQGAEFNPIDQRWLVRQRHAHAWTEIWNPTKGWQRIDPTSAIAPYRIENGLSAPSVPLLGATAPEWSRGFLQTARNLWDAVDTRWQNWLVTYQQTQQIDWLKKIGLPFNDFIQLAQSLIGSLVAIVLCLALLFAWRKRSSMPRPEQQAFEQLLKRLRQQGYDIPSNTTPSQLIDRIQKTDILVDDANRATEYLRQWIHLRYQPHQRVPTAKDWQTLSRQLQSITITANPASHRRSPTPKDS